MGSGCGDHIVEKILRPSGNSPSRWHLTRDLLLCSRNNIHHLTEKVNTHFKIIWNGKFFENFSEKARKVTLLLRSPCYNREKDCNDWR